MLPLFLFTSQGSTPIVVGMKFLFTLPLVTRRYVQLGPKLSKYSTVEQHESTRELEFPSMDHVYQMRKTSECCYYECHESTRESEFLSMDRVYQKRKTLECSNSMNDVSYPIMTVSATVYRNAHWRLLWVNAYSVIS